MAKFEYKIESQNDISVEELKQSYSQQIQDVLALVTSECSLEIRQWSVAEKHGNPELVVDFIDELDQDTADRINTIISQSLDLNIWVTLYEKDPGLWIADYKNLHTVETQGWNMGTLHLQCIIRDSVERAKTEAMGDRIDRILRKGGVRNNI